MSRPSIILTPASDAETLTFPLVAAPTPGHAEAIVFYFPRIKSVCMLSLLVFLVSRAESLGRPTYPIFFHAGLIPGHFFVFTRSTSPGKSRSPIFSFPRGKSPEQLRPFNSSSPTPAGRILGTNAWTLSCYYRSFLSWGAGSFQSE